MNTALEKGGKCPWLPALTPLVPLQYPLRITGALTSGLATCNGSISRLMEGCKMSREHTFGGTKVVIVLRMTKLILGKLLRVSFLLGRHSKVALRASHLQLRCLQAQSSGVSSFRRPRSSEPGSFCCFRSGLAHVTPIQRQSSTHCHASHSRTPLLLLPHS